MQVSSCAWRAITSGGKQLFRAHNNRTFKQRLRCITNGIVASLTFLTLADDLSCRFCCVRKGCPDYQERKLALKTLYNSNDFYAFMVLDVEPVEAKAEA